MTSKERVFAVLSGETPDRVPNLSISMGIAAKYAGYSYREYARDYRVLVASQIKFCRDFGIDMVSTISDPVREAADLGANIVFPESAPPYCTEMLIKKLPGELTLVDPHEGTRMRDRVEAVRLFKAEVGEEFPILGWVEGAFAEACDLYGLSQMMIAMFDETDAVHALLEFTLSQALAFAKAQIEAGADVIGVGDAATSLIGPELYEEFALPYQKRLFDAIHAMGARVKLHICGNVTEILPMMVESGADILDIDHMVDLKVAAEVANGKAYVCGNIDPVGVLLHSPEAEVAVAVEACLKALGLRNFFAPGCEIPAEVDVGRLSSIAEVIGTANA